ncbi:uncharacterized protein A1O5_07660 [Cladophialophora psammophila CBS 110553]|uniref:EF-hand domain-containing protein n=1 Tax=Cladophialophora psammophila CBS 110553 TaxID=1182543 RepID=W9XGY6_9EURO|nr:uncharacterized protein A1O5_07660 [Cladophialophora psammophila CBS 110553]EXJ69624.1 hypothetical protein A1O5_07660 [Cladophialophora psammophila CBS 110553]
MLLQPIVSAFLILLPPGTYAKCCWGDAIKGICGDGSTGTPCCGYKKCNAFCCACPGVSVIREVIEEPGIEWTSVITAPYDSVHSTYEEWTCRASHITTWYPPPATERALPEDSATTIFSASEPVATLTGNPQPTFTSVRKHPLDNHQMLSGLQETFDRVSNGKEKNGTSIITLDQYFGFFNVTDNGTETDFGKHVEAKFRAHDRNGDGSLTVEEAQLLCDRDGCY